MTLLYSVTSSLSIFFPVNTEGGALDTRVNTRIGRLSEHKSEHRPLMFIMYKIEHVCYTLDSPLRIPIIKNMGRDLAPEELRICP